MKSSLAVFLQLMFSGSNFLLFFLFTKLLNKNDFIFFSTAVAISIMAYAIAEGGISYIAPKMLAYSLRSRRKLSTIFITIGLSIYMSSIAIIYLIWNFVSKQQADLLWIISYTLYFIPIILLPSWFTSWFIEIKDIIIITLFRIMSLLLLYFFSSLKGLFLISFFYLLFVMFYLRNMNNRYGIFSVYDKKYFILAVLKLKEVFLSKTVSYFVYSSIPLVIASKYGSETSSLYVIGERIKSLYTTLFQPFIQTFYLWQFQSRIANNKFVITIILLVVVNFLTLFGLLTIVKLGYINFLGSRFSEIKNISLYIIAAFFAVNSAIILFFYILPRKKFHIFRQSVTLQMLSFIMMFILIYIGVDIKGGIILLLGELVLFLRLAIEILILDS